MTMYIHTYIRSASICKKTPFSFLSCSRTISIVLILALFPCLITLVQVQCKCSDLKTVKLGVYKATVNTTFSSTRVNRGKYPNSLSCPADILDKVMIVAFPFDPQYDRIDSHYITLQYTVKRPDVVINGAMTYRELHSMPITIQAIDRYDGDLNLYVEQHTVDRLSMSGSEFPISATYRVCNAFDFQEMKSQNGCDVAGSSGK
jgi:hypothetical protein